MLYPFLIALVWGSIPIIIKLYLSFLPNVFIICLQSLVLLFSSFIYAFVFKYKDFIHGINNVTYRTVFILAIVFFIASFICNIMYLHILKKDTIISPLIIFILTPIITILISSIVLNEILNIKQIFGCVLVSFGIFFLVYFKTDNNHSVKKLL